MNNYPGADKTLHQASVSEACRASPTQCDTGPLFPLPRLNLRAEIGLSAAPIFTGADFWTAYEVGWLNPRGKPQVAIAQFTVPCDTPNLFESESCKLYLNGFQQNVFESADAVQQQLRQDLTAAVWHGESVRSSVGVRLLLPAQWAQERAQALPGLSLDRLDVECSDYQLAPHWLRADVSQSPVEETLVSDLLKSHCRVTGQPDWGSVQIAYCGPPIDQAALLRYLVSFREHACLREQCVERIFMDIWERCRPTRLSVLARFLRRGGLDLNPWRTSHPGMPPAWVRCARQ